MRLFFEKFTDFYYSYNIKKATQLNEKRIDLKKITDITSKKLTDDEKGVFSELLTIPSIILRNIIGVRIGLEP